MKLPSSASERQVTDGTLLCPLTGGVLHDLASPAAMKAAHIVPHKLGKNTFRAIFGKNELHSPENVVYISQLADQAA
jgi:hypothetical protein